MSATILVVGDASSPFWRRGLVGAQAGHRIHFFSDARRELPGVESMIHPPQTRRARGVVRALTLERAIRRLRPDLVHVHFASQGLSSLPLARAPRVIVSTMGGDVLPEQGMLRSRRKRALLRLLLRRARAITCKSAKLEEGLLRWGDFAHKVHRINWGIDLEAFRPGLATDALRERYAIPAGDRVLFCARICQPLYNKLTVARAFARARAQGLVATLLISEFHADPAYLARLRALVEELGVQAQVRFVGAIPYADMPAHLNLADLVIAIPSSDGLPQSTLEAMACGAYPVVGDLAAYDEFLVDGVHGRRVSPHSVEALARALVEVSADPAQRAAVAATNREHVRALACERDQSARMNAIYERVLAGSDA